MKLRILCSVHLVRYPLGGQTWHHLQYLVGLQRLGHDVSFFEHYGWPDSCFDPDRNEMTADPSYGLEYLKEVVRRFDLGERWSYLAEDGTAYGMTRRELGRRIRECDLYLNLSNVNWIPELEEARSRVLIDTDPVFTQIGGHGMGGPFSRYSRLFTYGENVHRDGCSMPTAGCAWLPTRQPIVLDLWAVTEGRPTAPVTSVVNWSAYGDREHEGRVYGQKDRELEEFVSLPSESGLPLELALNAPPSVRERLASAGWCLSDPFAVTRTPASYQSYIQRSRGEFCVAKHGYVTTRCGWFSDRSAGYLASGRPVVLQDTGFSEFLPTERGLLSYETRAEAVSALQALERDYAAHCTVARELAEEFFDSDRVLRELLERCA